MPLMPTTIISTSPIYPTGLVVISDTTLQADAANFDVQSIPSMYKHLRIEAQLRGTTAATTQQARIRFNNDSGGNYYWFSVTEYIGGPAANEGNGETSAWAGVAAAASATATLTGTLGIDIPNYAATTFAKQFRGSSEYCTAASSTNTRVEDAVGLWNSTAAIERITLYPLADSFKAGSRLTIYGMGGVPSAEAIANVQLTSNLLNYIFTR